MEETLRKTEKIMNCVSCSWNQFCIEPPTYTKEEIEEKTKLPAYEKSIEGEDRSGKLMGDMLGAMMFMGKDTQCRACPQFIKLLSKDDILIKKIKQFMREL